MHSIQNSLQHATDTDPAVEGQLLSDYLDGDLKGATRLVNLIPLAQTQRESPSKISWLDQQQATNLAATKMPTVRADLVGKTTNKSYMKSSHASIASEIKNLVEAESSATHHITAAREDSHDYAQGNTEPSPISYAGGPSPFAHVQNKEDNDDKNKYSKYIMMPKYQRMLT